MPYTVPQTLNAIIEECSHGINNTMADLTLVQKQVLIAIAKKKQVSHLTSGAFYVLKR